MTDLSSLTVPELAEPMLRALQLELPDEVWQNVKARVTELARRAEGAEALAEALDYYGQREGGKIARDALARYRGEK